MLSYFFFLRKRVVLDCNIISFRNIDVSNPQYKLLNCYGGFTKKEVRLNCRSEIKDAVNVLVKNHEGGEFLKNVTISKVKQGVWIFTKTGFSAEGDVWGIE